MEEQIKTVSSSLILSNMHMYMESWMEKRHFAEKEQEHLQLYLV
jgi:hypothetical protein